MTSDVVIGGYAVAVVDGDFFLGGGFGSDETDGVLRGLRFLELPRPPSR